MGHSPAAAPWFSCVNAMNPADCCAANASSLGLRARASRRLNAPYANSQAGGGTLSRCTSWPTWFSLSLLFWKRVRALQPHWKVCQADTGFAQLQSGKIPGLVCGRLLHWAAADGVHPTLQLISQPQTQSTPRLEHRMQVRQPPSDSMAALHQETSLMSQVSTKHNMQTKRFPQEMPEEKQAAIAALRGGL